MPLQSASTKPRPAPLLVVPPPLMFAVAFGAGVLLQRFVALPPAAVADDLTWVGATVLAVSVCLGLSLAARFLVRRTTLKPFADPAVLVAGGPYRFSRNPMYLCLIVAYVGGALMFGSLWPFATLLVPLAVLTRIVVPFEEARMQAVFGARYQDYLSRVRRWL